MPFQATPCTSRHRRVTRSSSFPTLGGQTGSRRSERISSRKRGRSPLACLTSTKVARIGAVARRTGGARTGKENVAPGKPPVRVPETREEAEDLTCALIAKWKHGRSLDRVLSEHKTVKSHQVYAWRPYVDWEGSSERKIHKVCTPKRKTAPSNRTRQWRAWNDFEKTDPEKICSAWRKTGLFPVNRHATDDKVKCC
eukprot:jgi/Bigna1/76602/fgenesh1_pg.42_\